MFGVTNPRPVIARRCVPVRWIAAACICGAATFAQAQAPRDAITKPAEFRSTHFLLHTDMPAADARKLLDRLEVILGLISKYWGQPPNGEIECYVVRDLAMWPPEALSDVGRAKIKQASGITTTQTISQGKRFLGGKSIVYAAADTGTAEHEIVHAYCGQTFGRTGPLWYSEGMAELGQFWRPNEKGVQTKRHIIDYLRSEAPAQVREIVADNAADGEAKGAARTGDSWQAYAARWALCHLLVNNPNYAPRFRSLGLGYLNGAKVRFRDAFGAQADELQFEYRLFVENIEQGYRVDLCRWDWHHKFREPIGVASTARVMANRGWQPSGALVTQGKTYDYAATGTWKTDDSKMEVTADGAPRGAGRLEGVIFKDFALSEPFSLGEQGSFVAPGDGQLFLRCREPWHGLADNSGQLTVKISTSGGKVSAASAAAAKLPTAKRKPGG
jgi:hypothetical protein